MQIPYARLLHRPQSWMLCGRVGCCGGEHVKFMTIIIINYAQNIGCLCGHKFHWPNELSMDIPLTAFTATDDRQPKLIMWKYFANGSHAKLDTYYTRSTHVTHESMLLGATTGITVDVYLSQMISPAFRLMPRFLKASAMASECVVHVKGCRWSLSFPEDFRITVSIEIRPTRHQAEALRLADGKFCPISTCVPHPFLHNWSDKKFLLFEHSRFRFNHVRRAWIYWIWSSKIDAFTRKWWEFRCEYQREIDAKEKLALICFLFVVVSPPPSSPLSFG